MLNELFKPAWQSSSAEKRLKAVAGMDSANSESQKILTQLAIEDTDISVRIAAIEKLTSIAVLNELLADTDDGASQAAETRVNELLSTKDLLDEAQYRELMNGNPELKVRIAAHAEITTIRTESLCEMSHDDLLKVLTETGFTDTRQHIAEKLIEIEALESARKILRGKDKNAERILKTKIDEFRKQEKKRAENLAAVEKLIEEVEYLSSRDWRPEFKALLILHQSHYEKLDFEMDDVSKQRYQAARNIVEQRFEQQNIIEQTQLSQQQLSAETETFLKSLAGKDLSAAIDTLRDTLTRLDEFDARWKQLAEITSSDPAQQDQFDKMLSAMRSAARLVAHAAEIGAADIQTADTQQNNSGIDADEALTADNISAEKLAQNIKKSNTALQELNWPAAYGELQVAAELQQQLEKWRKTQKASADEYDKKLSRLHKKISSIFRATRAGNLARAKHTCESVEKALHQFAGNDRAALDERFEEARKSLGDMGDWKNFATEPKYIELCVAMEKLATSKQHPDKRSAEMKKLQKQWKSLGHSDISEQYWPRFKLAADTVYQPCAEFFAQRHKDRENHLKQRQQHVEQMLQLLEDTDWDNNPDYKAAQTTFRSINDHFISIKDVERNAGEKQWKQFSKLKDAIKTKLDVACETNITLKQQLIEQARTLAEADAREENLSRLKALQTSWKQIGITRRKQDQQSWDEFKKYGDMVYNKVRAQRQEKRDASNQQINAYREIIKEIKKLASKATDLAEADHQFEALQASYSELPRLHLPDLSAQQLEKQHEDLQREYQNACDQFDDCRSRIIDNMHDQQIDALRRKAALCTKLEALGASPSTEALEQISRQWQAIELHDTALSRRIEARKNSVHESIDQTAIAEQRRMLCIQLEIITGTESPAEDKALRMQYQLEQMNKSGLGRQAVKGNENLEDLEIDWLCMPGAEPEQQKALDERFLKALRSN
jgi:DNA repair protein SbcC/Rad50